MKNQGSVAVIHVAKYLDSNDRLCGHNCLFCMEQMEPGCSNEQLPTLETIDAAITHYCKSHGKMSKLYIAGGEPTLRGDFSELVALVRQHCQTIVLSTNCDYADENETIRRIIDAGIRHVATSIHGASSASHDYLTGKAGSFFHTISAMKKLMDAGSAVTVNTVVNAFNAQEMAEIAQMFQGKNLGIEKLTFTHYMHHGNAYYHNALWFNVDDCADTIAEAVKAADGVRYEVTFRDFPLCLNSGLAERQEIVEQVDIIGLQLNQLNVRGEKAPSFAKNKCRQCTLFDACPKYLVANYGEEINHGRVD